MAKITTSRIVAMVLTGVQILFCIILIGLAFAVPKAYPSLAALCLVYGFFGMFIPVMGLFGIICKNTCLMMVYIICCILSMIDLAVTIPVIFIAAIALSTAEGQAEFVKALDTWADEEDKKHPGTLVIRADFPKPGSTAGLLWGLAVICILDLAWMGANTHFYFKARKEAKAEEMRAVFGGMTPGYPPPTTPSAPSK